MPRLPLRLHSSHRMAYSIISKNFEGLTAILAGGHKRYSQKASEGVSGDV